MNSAPWEDGFEWTPELLAIQAQHKGIAQAREESARAKAQEAEKSKQEEIRAKQVDFEAYKLGVMRDGRSKYLTEINGFGLFDDQAAFTIADYKRPYSYEPLIEGVLERGTLGMLYADSFVGKSYLSLDWALSIASGSGRWCGRPVSKARVLYIAMEGVNSLETRWQAWSEYHGVDLANVPDFVIYPKVVDFNSEDSVTLLVNYIRAGGFELTVIDMVKQALGGADENSPTDVGVFMNKLAELREATPGNAVLYIHHSKKDDPRMYRGATPFYGSADFVWCMTRVDSSERGKRDPRRKLECTKWKNSAGTIPTDINLEFLTVGPDSVLDVGASGDIYSETLEELVKTGKTPISQADFARHVVAKTKGSSKTATNRISAMIKDGKLAAEHFKNGKPAPLPFS